MEHNSRLNPSSVPVTMLLTGIGQIGCDHAEQIAYILHRVNQGGPDSRIYPLKIQEKTFISTAEDEQFIVNIREI